MRMEKTDNTVRQMMKKRIKGLMGLLLAAAMLLAAVPMQNVQAAGNTYNFYSGAPGSYTWQKNGIDLPESFTVQAGDTIHVDSGSCTIVRNWDGMSEVSLDFGNHTIDSDYAQYQLDFRFLGGQSVRITLTPIMTAGDHQHDMQWTVFKKVTLTEDGKEGYQCRICGEVLQSSIRTISAYRYFGEYVIDQVEKAQPGDTVLIDTLIWKSSYKEVYEAIAARPDITVTFRFAFDGYIFDITIPEGADVLSLLNEEGYIGFIKLADEYGAVMVSEE